MQSRRLVLASMAILTAALIGAPTATAHTLVDPTTLTPPLRADRLCYEDGPWVTCDTSTTHAFVSEPAGELSCGPLYWTFTETLNSTRWYMAGLLVERHTVYSMRGFWSLSAEGAGPTIDTAADFSWHERFVIPGDLSSDVEVTHGNFIRVTGLGSIGMDAGIFNVDGTFRGLSGENVPEEDPALCALLAA